jgi:hypothetical protein
MARKRRPPQASSGTINTTMAGIDSVGIGARPFKNQRDLPPELTELKFSGAPGAKCWQESGA